MIKGVAGTVLSVNLSDFIKVEKKIQNKIVILVFDDLERSQLSIEEKLGAINEYCENQHINVIIVADEDKISNESYKEFKEKVIQRTVRHVPNYADIVSSIINRFNDSDYKKFLKNSEKEIAALFAGTDVDGESLDRQSIEKIDHGPYTGDRDREKEKERKRELIKHRPHNIRTLKSAFQDFERVYDILKTRQISDSYKWLFSFLSFSLAIKANLVRKSDRYGMLFGKEDVALLYPGFFDPRFLPAILSDWIIDGSYDEDELISCIDDHYKSEEALTPKDRVRYNRIDFLDECEAIQGLREILLDAYSGVLELNEYVTFIFNSKLSREYGLVDLDIEWEKVCEGIYARIEEHVKNGEKRELYTESISDLTDFSEGEKKAYEIIKKARDSSFAMFEVNRRAYILAMNDSPYDAFTVTSNKRYDCFDIEMAHATLNAFKAVDNPTKTKFPGYFEGMWLNYRNSFDIGENGIEKTIKGFSTLRNQLQILCKEYETQPFKKKFTETFITVMDNLLMDKEITKDENLK